VSGAGDTVAGVLALSLSSGANMEEAGLLATHAASVVIRKAGTATLNVKELSDSLKNE